MLQTIKIFTTSIFAGRYDQFINEILKLTDHTTSSYVCFANVHMIIESYNDYSFNETLNKADLIAPDGRPLSIFMKLSTGRKQDRICGMDVFPDLLREAEKNNKSVYFYGTTEDVLQKILDKASAEFPHIKIAGHYSPPFRELSAQEEEIIIDQINNAHPDLLFVSLGCPKQEKWVGRHKGKIKSCMLALGQAFNVYAGTEKRLPKWMRNLSLEWLYRLYLEPKRLWRRYVYGNSKFIMLSVKYLLMNRLSTVNGNLHRKHA